VQQYEAEHNTLDYTCAAPPALPNSLLLDHLYHTDIHLLCTQSSVM